MDADTITPADRIRYDGSVWNIQGVKRARRQSYGAGTLDQRITIERATSTTNDLNESVKVWTSAGNLWAAREDVSDGEMIQAGELGAFQATRFIVRSGTRARFLEIRAAREV